MEAEFPTYYPLIVRGATTFEEPLGRRYVLQRRWTTRTHRTASRSSPRIPAGPAAGCGTTSTRAASSGLYDMSFDGYTWTLTRRAADFSPLDFAQRFTADLGDGGDTLTGRWEIALEARPGSSTSGSPAAGWG